MEVPPEKHIASIALISVSLVSCGTRLSTPSDVPPVIPRSDVNIDSASEFVVVSQSEPAFIIFTGIPEDIDEDQFEEIKREVASQETLTMLNWQKFFESVNDYARSVILRKDYPNIRVVDGIVCLVASKREAGAPGQGRVRGVRLSAAR